MKIAIYYNLPFGGAKRSVQEHVKGLVNNGHIVDVYTLDRANDMFDPGTYAHEEFQFVHKPYIIKFPILERISKDLDTFLNLRRTHKKIASVIDEKNYDVVLIHHDVNTNSPYLSLYLKTKNIFYCMEPLRNVYEYALRISDTLSLFNKFYESINRYIRKRIDRTNALAANHMLTLSHFGREYIIRSYNLFPKIVYLGVDTKVFKPLVVKKKNQVLFLAEKESIYGYDFALEALNRIPKSIRPELKIVYGTKGKKYHISDEELATIYNESVATLSLSKFDTFGLVPLESMACGIPVIAFNVAGYRETIEDTVTGFLVDFEAQQIADKIMFLIQNKNSAKEMGLAGRKCAEEKWDWKLQITQLEDNLKQILTK